MAEIHFFDDPQHIRRPREEVRLNQIGLHVHPDGRRVSVGFEITPFQERPSLEVAVRDRQGRVVGTLTVIEALQSSFHLTMHLRDPEPGAVYDVEAIVYYAAPGEARQIVDRRTARFILEPQTPGDAGS